MAAENRPGMVEVAGDDGDVGGVPSVAEDDEGVAPQVVGPATGQVEAPETGEKVLEVEDLDGVHPAAYSRRLAEQAPPRRADDEALVATVEPVADRRPQLGGDVPPALDEGGEAAAGIDDPGATIASVGQAGMHASHVPQDRGSGSEREARRR